MKDESAPCGCRRVEVAGKWRQVVWCPEHHRGCPGPWYESNVQRSQDDFYEPNIDPDCNISDADPGL